MTSIRDQFDVSDATVRTTMQAQTRSNFQFVKDGFVQARIAEDISNPGSRALMARLK